MCINFQEFRSLLVNLQKFVSVEFAFFCVPMKMNPFKVIVEKVMWRGFTFKREQVYCLIV